MEILNRESVALILLVVIIYLLDVYCSGFNMAINFLVVCGTLATVWVMYKNLCELKRQFKGSDKPVVVVDNVKLYGDELTFNDTTGLTRPYKFTIKFTLNNFGDATAFNIFVQDAKIVVNKEINIDVLDWKNNCFSSIGKGMEKIMYKTLELDIAQQICDYTSYNNEDNPILYIELYYRNLNEQWFKNIQEFELKEVWRVLNNGVKRFGGEGIALTDVQDFSFYIVEHNSRKTGNRTVNYSEVEEKIKS